MAVVDLMDEGLAAARRRLLQDAGLSGKTVTADRSALVSWAEARRQAIDPMLTQLAGRLLTDMSAAEQFTTLSAEWGQLNALIARTGATNR